MDKNQSKQIAEALGLYEKQDGFLAFWFSPEGWKITLPGGRFVVGKDLEVWLESPAGEKAVRDKVRELCKELGLSFIYHWAYWGGRVTDSNRIIFKASRDREYPTRVCDTESSAWLAALEFLVERKGK